MLLQVAGPPFSCFLSSSRKSFHYRQPDPLLLFCGFLFFFFFVVLFSAFMQCQGRNFVSDVAKVLVDLYSPSKSEKSSSRSAVRITVTS